MSFAENPLATIARVVALAPFAPVAPVAPEATQVVEGVIRADESGRLIPARPLTQEAFAAAPSVRER